MSLPKGIFISFPRDFDKVYSPQDRKKIHTLVDAPDYVFSPSEAIARPELLRDVELIFSTWGAPRLDSEFLDMVPNLKAFFYAAGTIREFVTDDFWAKNIPISTAALANAVPVAEYTCAQIVLSLKRVWWFMREVLRTGTWMDVNAPGCEVFGCYGSTVGIISLSKVGLLLLDLLRSYDVNVIVYDPFVSQERARELGVELVTLDEIFSRSDVVSLHAPLLPETEGMITKANFMSMKCNATFINTARGQIIREAEMLEALVARPDLHIVIDVAVDEPPQKGSLLYTLPNVVMTPHIAGSKTNECWRMGRMMVDEADRFLKGMPLQHQVTQQMTLISA